MHTEDGDQSDHTSSGDEADDDDDIDEICGISKGSAYESSGDTCDYRGSLSRDDSDSVVDNSDCEGNYGDKYSESKDSV